MPWAPVGTLVATISAARWCGDADTADYLPNNIERGLIT
jgi:hypothetical protein